MSENFKEANTVSRERILPMPVNCLSLSCNICLKEMPATGHGAEVELEDKFLTVCKSCCNDFANILEELKELDNEC